MNVFTIKDLEHLSGIKAHTIRVWEQRYSFIKPQRTGTNIRYYNNAELKVLLDVALLNKYGFKISHINRMSEAELVDRISHLSQGNAQIERMVNQLVQSMVDTNPFRFEELLNTYIAGRGIERVINQIIFPFLDKTGMLWTSNHIHPAQEHLISLIIRQKLVAGIEQTASHVPVDKTFLLFLPENEHQELGLILMHYLLKSRGARVLYLGGNVPKKDLDWLVQEKEPDFLYTHLSSDGGHFNLEKLIATASSRWRPTSLIVSGPATLLYKKPLPPQVILHRSLLEGIEFVAGL